MDQDSPGCLNNAIKIFGVIFLVLLLLKSCSDNLGNDRSGNVNQGGQPPNSGDSRAPNNEGGREPVGENENPPSEKGIIQNELFSSPEKPVTGTNVARENVDNLKDQLPTVEISPQSSQPKAEITPQIKDKSDEVKDEMDSLVDEMRRKVDSNYGIKDPPRE